MRKEELGMEKMQNNPESVEDHTEKMPQEALEDLEKRSEKEEEMLSEVESRVGESDQDFQKEAAENGVLSSLGKTIKKNKLMRAALVGLSLYSANPALASELNNVLRESPAASSEESLQNEDSSLIGKLNQLSNISDLHKKELVQIYAEAPDEAKKIILDELEGVELNDESVLESSEDPELLVLQQEIIDLQNSGEVAPRRKGGVILPFDKEHSGKSNDVEYSNNELAENEGRRKITIENASENQIRAWVNYLKNPKKARGENKKTEEASSKSTEPPTEQKL